MSNDAAPSASWLINFLAGWSQKLGADWKTAKEVRTAIRHDGVAQGLLYRAAQELPGAAGMTGLKFAQFLLRIENVDVGGYRLRKEFDTSRGVWLYSCERTRTRRQKVVRPPRVKRPPRVREPRPARSVVGQSPTEATDVSRLVAAAARQRAIAPGGREAEEMPAPKAAPLVDPFAGEVVTGPFLSRDDADVAAGRLLKHGLGARAEVREHELELYVVSVGAGESARLIADTVRRVYRCAITRIGLRGHVPTPEELRQRAAGAAQDNRSARLGPNAAIGIAAANTHFTRS